MSREGIGINLTVKILGVFSGLFSICLWIILNYFTIYSSPTNYDTKLITFLLLFLPACLAISATLRFQKSLMLLAFLSSLPISLYLVGTPGIFALFGVTNVSYLICFLLMKVAK